MTIPAESSNSPPTSIDRELGDEDDENDDDDDDDNGVGIPFVFYE